MAALVAWLPLHDWGDSVAADTDEVHAAAAALAAGKPPPITTGMMAKTSTGLTPTHKRFVDQVSSNLNTKPPEEIHPSIRFCPSILLMDLAMGLTASQPHNQP